MDTGDLSHSEIRIDPNFLWFEDPTPGDDSEFPGGGPPGFDLLSVVRHEIGHAVGWVGDFSQRVAIHLVDGSFDPGRLNIATVDQGSHSNPSVHIGDLMIPSIGTSTRRSITLYPNAALTARAFFYTIPMRFGDPDYVGPETGSANEPWNTMAEAFSLTPAAIPILLAGGTYSEPGPISRADPTTLTVARDAIATISPP